MSGGLHLTPPPGWPAPVAAGTAERGGERRGGGSLESGINPAGGGRIDIDPVKRPPRRPAGSLTLVADGWPLGALSWTVRWSPVDGQLV